MKSNVCVGITVGIVVSILIGVTGANGRDDNQRGKVYIDDTLSRSFELQTASPSNLSEYDRLTRSIQIAKNLQQGIENDYQQFQKAKFGGLIATTVYYVPKITLDVLGVAKGPVGAWASGLSTALDMYKDSATRIGITPTTAYSIGATAGSVSLDRMATIMTNNNLMQLARSKPIEGWSLSRGVLVPSSYINSTKLITQVDAYKNVAHMGEKLAPAGAVLSFGVDVKNWVKDVNYYNNLERDFASNKQSVSQNIRGMEDRCALLLIKDRNLLDREIFHTQTKSIQPFVYNSGLPSLHAVSQGAPTNNITLSTSAVNSYIGGATNRNGVISRTLDAHELGYRSVDGYGKSWVYTGPNSSFTLPSHMSQSQMSFRQTYQFKPPKLPSTSYSASRSW